MSRDDETLAGVIGRMRGGERGSKASIGEVLAGVGNRSYGPLLLVPAIIIISPVGALPGMALVIAGLFALIAGQLLLGRATPWLPKRLLELEYDRERVDKALAKTEGVAKRIDRVAKPRMEALTGEAGARAVAVACLLIAVLMIPAGVVPGGNAAGGVAVLPLALGLIARDGLLVALGLAATAAAAGLCLYWLL